MTANTGPAKVAKARGARGCSRGAPCSKLCVRAVMSSDLWIHRNNNRWEERELQRYRQMPRTGPITVITGQPSRKVAPLRPQRPAVSHAEQRCADNEVAARHWQERCGVLEEQLRRAQFVIANLQQDASELRIENALLKQAAARAAAREAAPPTPQQPSYTVYSEQPRLHERRATGD